MNTQKLVNFNHLKEIKSGYFKHLFIALYFVTLLTAAAITGFIHAFFPFLFPFVPYQLNKKIAKETEEYFITSKDI